MDDRGIGDPFGYLLAIIGKGPGEVRDFLDQRRRELAALGADDDPAPPKPPWCGECDERTRLADLDDGRVTRCIRCHPLSVRPPKDPARHGDRRPPARAALRRARNAGRPTRPGNSPTTSFTAGRWAATPDASTRTPRRRTPGSTHFDDPGRGRGRAGRGAGPG
jgi:hypothetical protein